MTPDLATEWFLSI
jgi:hypothetical protein